MAAPMNLAPLDGRDGQSPIDGAPADAGTLRPFVMALFFIFGGITSLNDVLIPKLKELFTLNYTQAMMIQFCFFTAYLLIGLPAARLVGRIGYMRGAVVGLLVMATGCLLFIPASLSARYPVFLLALFVLASGVVLVQVVANPLISLLGPARTAPSRLTFAQAFNSLGTTLFPVVGAVLILGALSGTSASQLQGAELDAYRTAESRAIVNGYAGLAAALLILGGVVWLARSRLPHEKPTVRNPGLGLDLLRQARFRRGAICIFLYVGAEVAIGSLIVSYLSQANIMGLGEKAAGSMIGLYWGGAMVGRFLGSAVLRVISPGKVLATHAAIAVMLLLAASTLSGPIAGYGLLAIGLANSIMFPTIFSLASEGMGPRAPDASGIINVAIFGGAVVPMLTGVLADLSGSLSAALMLPAVCYVAIAAFGWSAKQPADYAFN